MASRAYNQVKRAEQAAGTRARILTAARAVLTEDGPAVTSVEAIAERAGVTRKTVYERFGTKAGLLRALVDDIVVREGIEETVADLAALPSPVSALQGFVAMAVRIWEHEAGVTRAILVVAETDAEAAETMAYANAGRRKDAATIVGRLAEVDLVRPDWSPRRATDLLWAATSFETFDFVRRRGSRSLATTIEIVNDMASAMLVEQPRGRTS